MERRRSVYTERWQRAVHGQSSSVWRACAAREPSAAQAGYKQDDLSHGTLTSPGVMMKVTRPPRKQSLRSVVMYGGGEGGVDGGDGGGGGGNGRDGTHEMSGMW